MQGPSSIGTPESQGYLFSDRLLNGPLPANPPFQGAPQAFALKGAEPMQATIQRLGGGQYHVQLRFTGPINRTFEITGHCIGAAIVGTAPAIGNNERVDSATYVVAVAGANDCGALDASLSGSGSRQVTVASNQPDGIAGYSGAFTVTADGSGRFVGGAGRYLFSDRTIDSTDPSAVRPGQPFSIAAWETLEVTLTRQGTGQYAVVLHFPGAINRTFQVAGQCVGGAIVVQTPAIGNSEQVSRATCVITLGAFNPDPVIN
jgi:hypothetical protein